MAGIHRYAHTYHMCRVCESKCAWAYVGVRGRAWACVGMGVRGRAWACVRGRGRGRVRVRGRGRGRGRVRVRVRVHVLSMALTILASTGHYGRFL